jgi:bifunctional DNA-binding transcriptional regulator/antitoxin component of YhaV-PrlF toxin-antitoxin module
MNIDIERLKEIREELDAMNEADVLYIDQDRKAKYVIMPVELYDTLEELLNVLNTPVSASVRIAAPEEIDLSYDEYERIKKQIMEAVEKTFMPKPEKLNG